MLRFDYSIINLNSDAVDAERTKIVNVTIVEEKENYSGFCGRATFEVKDFERLKAKLEIHKKHFKFINKGEIK